MQNWFNCASAKVRAFLYSMPSYKKKQQQQQAKQKKLLEKEL